MGHNTRFRTLSAIAGGVRILAYIVFGVGVIAMFIALAVPGFRGWEKVGAAIVALLAPAIVGFGLIAWSERTEVLLAIEGNTRAESEFIGAGGRTGLEAAPSPTQPGQNAT